MISPASVAPMQSQLSSPSIVWCAAAIQRLPALETAHLLPYFQIFRRLHVSSTSVFPTASPAVGLVTFLCGAAAGAGKGQNRFYHRYVQSTPMWRARTEPSPIQMHLISSAYRGAHRARNVTRTRPTSLQQAREWISTPSGHQLLVFGGTTAPRLCPWPRSHKRKRVFVDNGVASAPDQRTMQPLYRALRV